MFFTGLIVCVSGIRVWHLLSTFEVALHRRFTAVSAMRTLPVIVIGRGQRFDLFNKATYHPKISAKATAGANFYGDNLLDIDVCRFQGVFFDKDSAWFNRIPHQGGEQLVGSDSVLNGHTQHAAAFWIHGGFP